MFTMRISNVCYNNFLKFLAVIPLASTVTALFLSCCPRKLESDASLKDRKLYRVFDFQGTYAFPILGNLLAFYHICFGQPSKELESEAVDVCKFKPHKPGAEPPQADHWHITPPQPDPAELWRTDPARLIPKITDADLQHAGQIDFSTATPGLPATHLDACNGWYTPPHLRSSPEVLKRWPEGSFLSQFRTTFEGDEKHHFANNEELWTRQYKFSSFEEYEKAYGDLTQHVTADFLSYNPFFQQFALSLESEMPKLREKGGTAVKVLSWAINNAKDHLNFPLEYPFRTLEEYEQSFDEWANAHGGNGHNEQVGIQFSIYNPAFQRLALELLTREKLEALTKSQPSLAATLLLRARNVHRSKQFHEDVRSLAFYDIAGVPFNEIVLPPKKFEKTPVRIIQTITEGAVRTLYQEDPTDDIAVDMAANAHRTGGGMTFLFGTQEEQELPKTTGAYVAAFFSEFTKNMRLIYKQQHHLPPGGVGAFRSRYLSNLDDHHIPCTVLLNAVADLRVGEGGNRRELSEWDQYGPHMPNRERDPRYLARIKLDMRAILITALLSRCTRVILPATGTGAFDHLPPEVEAQAWKEVLQEFNGHFKEVVFAIPGNNLSTLFNNIINR